MNNKAFTISLVLAALSVLMIFQYVTSQEEAIKSKYGTPTAVVVAKKNISEMEVIDEKMIDIIEKPKQFVEPGRTTSKEEVVGFIASVPLRKGEQITLNKIVAPGVRTGLSKQISPGKRAISIAVSNLNAANKLIKPADRVDILATIDLPGAQRGNQISKVILQDIPVLAVGEFITAQSPRVVYKDDVSGAEKTQSLNMSTNFSTIVVEVEPQNAAQLALLNTSDSVKLTLLLRNNDDTERVNFSAMNIADVLGSDATRVPRAPAGAR